MWEERFYMVHDTVPGRVRGQNVLWRQWRRAVCFRCSRPINIRLYTDDRDDRPTRERAFCFAISRLYPFISQPMMYFGSELCDLMSLTFDLLGLLSSQYMATYRKMYPPRLIIISPFLYQRGIYFVMWVLKTFVFDLWPQYFTTSYLLHGQHLLLLRLKLRRNIMCTKAQRFEIFRYRLAYISKMKRNRCIAYTDFKLWAIGKYWPAQITPLQYERKRIMNNATAEDQIFEWSHWTRLKNNSDQLLLGLYQRQWVSKYITGSQ